MYQFQSKTFPYCTVINSGLFLLDVVRDELLITSIMAFSVSIL